MSDLDDLPLMEDVPEAQDQNTLKEEKKDSDIGNTASKTEDTKKEDIEKKPLRWYVIQAFSGYEQRVVVTLKERIQIHQMEDDFGEILVPKEKVKEIKDGRKKESERKFFPGYVLIQMRMTPETWQLVKHTDRVLGFIGGSAEKPLPITTAEAEKILSRLRESEESPRPKTIFEVGEKVRAIDGAFKDFVGTVEKVDYEKNRLTVSITFFGRAAPVDLEFSQVEKDL